MKATNKLLDFVAPAKEPTTVKRADKSPRKTAPQTSKDVQMTTIRLSADDHLAVRTLALRDSMTMNGLVLEALRAYCAQRGVRLNS